MKIHSHNWKFFSRQMVFQQCSFNIERAAYILILKNNVEIYQLSSCDLILGIDSTECRQSP